MTARNTVRLTCDFCGDESAGYNNIDEAKRAGWIVGKFPEKNLVADKHICDECALGITQAVEKRRASK